MGCVSDDVICDSSLPGSTGEEVIIDGWQTDAGRCRLVEHECCAAVDLSKLFFGRFTDEQIHGEEDTAIEKAMVSNDMYMYLWMRYHDMISNNMYDTCVGCLQSRLCTNKKRCWKPRGYHRAVGHGPRLAGKLVDKDAPQDQNFT